MSKQEKHYNASNCASGRIVRMKKFRIFAVIHRSNKQAHMITKNVAALANMNVKAATQLP
ncbi:MAG: hypothetical protein HRT36_05755 [Alphaproteobacteria bacterium]|nr:hypothetical protein [Alphaproteobacteria bacterium]